jgi:cyclophilin family peptidyl-prolyl cis-trans isomerase
MAKIAGKENTNSSQFFITFNKCRWCDSKNVAFGRVVVGLNYIKSIQQLEVDKNDYDPIQRVVIDGCGVFKDKVPQEAIDLVMNPPKKKKEQPKKIE